VVHVIAPPEPAPASSYQAPIGPSDEYVFVRRDGTVFFAVAYSWENGALRYITNKGLRGTMTRDSLDLSATQQFNEQRGLSFPLSGVTASEINSNPNRIAFQRVARLPG